MRQWVSDVGPSSNGCVWQRDADREYILKFHLKIDRIGLGCFFILKCFIFAYISNAIGLYCVPLCTVFICSLNVNVSSQNNSNQSWFQLFSLKSALTENGWMHCQFFLRQLFSFKVYCEHPVMKICVVLSHYRLLCVENV